MEHKEKLIGFAKNNRFKKNIKKIPTDLLFIQIWIVLSLIFIIIPIIKDSIIRIIFGIPMILFIPGYNLISSLFPKKHDLDYIERFILSLGMSIAIVALIGLGLNYTPFGIRLISIIISLIFFDILMILITNYKRGLLPDDQRFNIDLKVIYDKFIAIKDQGKTDKILTILLIFSMVMVIGMLIYVITIPKTGEKLTEFYILNSSWRNADNYTNNLKLGSPSTLMVGVVNHEYSLVNYTIQIYMDNNILNTEDIELNNNETWEKNMTFLPNKEGNDIKLEFLLYKNKNFTKPYRELHLWENVTAN